MTFKTTIFLLIVTTSNIVFGAGTCFDCQIEKIGQGPYYDSACTKPSCVFIKMNKDIASRPSCSIAGWDYVIDSSTDSGKATLSTLLMAYAAQKSVNVSGNNRCTLYAEYEDINYIQLK